MKSLLNKCLSFALLFGLSSIALLAFSSDKAQAFDTASRSCTGVPSTFLYENLTPTFNPATSSYILFQYSPTAYYLIYNNSQQLLVGVPTSSSTTGAYLDVGTGSYMAVFGADGNTSGANPRSAQWTADACIVSGGNLAYHQNFTPPEITNIFSAPPAVPCPNNPHIDKTSPTCIYPNNPSLSTGAFNPAIRLADRLRLKEPDGKINDYSNSWPQGLKACGTGVYESFLSQLEDGKYSVSQASDQFSNPLYIDVSYANNPETAHLFWHFNDSTNNVNDQYRVYAADAVNQLKYYRLTRNSNGFSCQTINGSTAYISTNDSFTTRFTSWISTYEFLAPVGYTGLSTRETANVISADDYLYYKIVNYDATFQMKDVPDEVTECRLYVDDNPDNDNITSINESVYDFVDCGSEVYHRFPEYGDYYVRVELKFTNEWRQYTRSLTIDGRTFEGKLNETGDIPIGGIIYNDCTVFGAELGAQLDCYIDNFFIGIGSFLSSLFIPRQSVLQARFSEMFETMKTSLGFLLYPFEFVIDVFTAISNGSNTGGANCNIGSVPLFGTNSGAMELCAWRHQIPQLWTLMQVVAQGFISIALVRMLMGKINHLLGAESDQNDDYDYDHGAKS